MKKIWFATKNKGKIKEIKSILTTFKVMSLNDLNINLIIDEDGKTFKQNALIKAKFLIDYIDEVFCIGDDSGLCIKEINNFPGIYSARWAGEGINDYERSHKILDLMKKKKLNNFKKRKAYLITVLALYNIKTKKIKYFYGKLKGTIGFNIQGGNGFGYDNIFIPKNQTKPLSMLDVEYKNKYGHRSIALNKLKKYLEKNEKN